MGNAANAAGVGGDVELAVENRRLALKSRSTKVPAPRVKARAGGRALLVGDDLRRLLASAEP
jgi:hypothetical protein